jgi:hypothetical protein
LAGAVGGFVDVAACGRTADHFDQLGADHSAAAFGTAAPAARARASWT